MRFTAFLSWVVLPALCTAFPALAGSPNTLTKAEKSAGWHLLFDGSTTDQWRSIKGQDFPRSGWTVENGWLHCTGEKGGDIVTMGTFEQFELEFEWRLDKGANSGVKYFVVPSRGLSLGHEYQLIDDKNHPDANLADGKRTTASFYDVFGRNRGISPRPFGKVNKSRILVRGDHVEHWLNGRKAVEYDCDSEATMNAVRGSKFKQTPDFGKRLRGHIQLQDHQSKVWFRNLKIREIAGSK